MDIQGKIIIADDLFSSRGGHCYEYNKAISIEWKRREVTVEIYGVKDIEEDIKKELGVIPFFNTKIGESGIYLLGGVLAFFKHIYQTRKLLKRYRENDIFFIPNIVTRNIFIYAFAVASMNKHPKVVLLYRHSISNSTYSLKIYKLAHILISKKIKKGKVLVTSDSEVIADEVEKKLKKKVTVLPIPHTFEVLSKGHFRRNNLINIFMPGEARLEKGIDILVDAIEILVIKQQTQGLRFLIQMYQNTELHNSHMTDVTSKLEKLKRNCDIVILYNLSTTKYYENFLSADIILTPYRPSKGYNARTSGIFSEALAFGKPVIATNNTWMSLQLSRCKSGVCFEENNPEDLASSIQKVVDFYNDFHTMAKDNSTKWLSFHNPRSFCDVFLNLTSW